MIVLAGVLGLVLGVLGIVWGVHRCEMSKCRKNGFCVICRVFDRES